MAQGLFGTSTPAAQLQQTRLQPAGVASAPVVRPQQVQTGGNLRALAEALGGLSSSLRDYAAVGDKIKDDPNSRANEEWIARAQQMGKEDLMALATSGEADGHRAREDALNALLGERAYADFLPATETYFATEFDRTTGDAAAEYDRRRQEYAAALPNDVARAAFYKNTEQHRARTIGGVTDERIANTKEQINTTIVDGWYTRITEAGKDGSVTPEEVSAAVFDASNSNSAFFGLSGQEQNATIWALAQRLAADGKVDEATALLNTPRKGADGAALPALSTIPEYSVKGTSLIEAAKTQKAKAASEGSVARRREIATKVDEGELTLEDIQPDIDSGLFTDAQAAGILSQSDSNRRSGQTRVTLAEAARRDEQDATISAAELMEQHGGINRIVDVEVRTPSGGTKTLSRADRIESVRRSKEVEWADAEAKLVSEQGMDPAQAKAAMSDVRQGWYINQFLPNDEWARTFASLPATITPIALEKNPALATKASASAELYFNLREKSPAYAETLVTPASRDFLETYATAREVDGMSPEEAVSAAASYTSMGRVDKARAEIPPKDRAKIVSTVFSGSKEGTDGYTAQPTGASLQIVNDQINRMAARGVPPDAIAARLKTWVSERTISVNGVMVPVQRGMSADFPILVDRHLKAVFEAKKGVLSSYGIDGPEGLSIAPMAGETRWAVIDKQTGLPIGSMNLTPETLDALKKDRKAELEAETRANLAAADADAAGRKKAFEERVEWYDEMIAMNRAQGSKLRGWMADDLEAEKQDYINQNNPEWVKEQSSKADAKTRNDARHNAFILGMDDPFPEDGEIPDDWKREVNAMEQRWGGKVPYPDVK